MRRLFVSSSAVFAAGLLCFVSQSACNATRDDGGQAPEPVQSARELVTRVHTVFRASMTAEDGRSEQSISLLGPSLARTFDRGSTGISPYFTADVRNGARQAAEVTLPNRAGGAFSISDRKSGLAVEVSLVGARDVGAEAVDGYLVYRDAVAAGHVVQRPQPDGTEDWVLFDAAPSVPELRYRLKLGTAVAGLRLVADTLELVDAGGAPRLRMAPPVLVGGDGARHWASVEVIGCAVDTSPKDPWGRAPVGPGARSCEVSIRWGSAIGQKDPVYPALMDPAWTLTGNMTVRRYYHTATPLGDGRVLVVGGQQDNTTVHNKTELFSPGPATFSSSSPMASARVNHAACVLSDGRVMVAGGKGAGGAQLATAEVFDPNTAQWTALNPMSTARVSFTLTQLPSGEVLAAGGDGLSTAELYVVANDSWQSAASMNAVRGKQTATLLTSGKVLVTGGESPVSPTIQSTAELYDRTSNSWTLTPDMNVARASHTATALDNGLVLVAGGDGNPVVDGAQLYDTAGNTWTLVDTMLSARRYHTASRLLNGRVVLAGGYTTAYLSSSEIFDQGTDPDWTTGSDMKTARIKHTSTTLNNGKILVAGGQGLAGGLSTAELFELQKNGVACVTAAECTTGWCIDGVCCDTECTGLCMGCTAAIKGQGSDGACGPVALGVDTQDECESLGSGFCQTSGNCDGNGACSTKDGQSCEGSLCIDVNTQQNPSTCDVNGVCVPQGQAACAPYLCQGSACLTTCTSEASCVAGGACIDSECKMPGDNGTTCGGNPDCKSGNCVDMLCCDSPCNSVCYSCRANEKDSGPNGICGPAKVGLACGGTACSLGTQTGPQCTATQTCETATIACSPYLCADSEKCATTCTSISQCKPGNFCNTNTSQCLPKGAVGAMCAGPGECQSGFCVDFVCCAGTCGGNNSNATDCQACSVAKGSTADGTCTLLTNTVCDYSGGIAGVCASGVCIEGKVDAGPDAPKDAPGDTLPSEGGDSSKPDTSAPEAGKGGSAGTGGGAPDATPDSANGGAAGEPVVAPPPAGDSGGCGCRTPAGSTTPGAWLALLGAAVIAIRRRSRN